MARETREAKRIYEECKIRYDRLVCDSAIRMKELGFL